MPDYYQLHLPLALYKANSRYSHRLVDPIWRLSFNQPHTSLSTWPTTCCGIIIITIVIIIIIIIIIFFVIANAAVTKTTECVFIQITRIAKSRWSYCQKHM